MKWYLKTDGSIPFQEWLENLRDNRAEASILTRVERAKAGLFGEYRDLKDGLFEFKDRLGPGYRIYFGTQGDEIIVLLLGGNKRTQDSDIEKARKYWADFLRRTGK